jgi:peptidoglycan/LPS O-acetylase OafA/YrhL
MFGKRLVELDALRGFAAIAVVFYHYLYRYNEIYGNELLVVKVARFGEYGVQLFFIISGFVIYWTLSKAKKPLDFVVSRFSRLFPVYWVAVIVTYFAVFLFGLPGRQVEPVDALLNLLMFHEYFNIQHVDGVYWTLTVELTFYFWIYIFYVFRAFNNVELCFLPFILLACMRVAGFSYLSDFDDFFILKYIPFFVSGICLYKIRERFSLKTLAVLILCLCSEFYIYSWKLFIVFLFFTVIFYLSVKGYFKFLRFRPFVFFGGLSYSSLCVNIDVASKKEAANGLFACRKAECVEESTPP